MPFADLENFLFVPADYSCSEGWIYELGPAQASYIENAFVLLPYQNPQTGKVAPQFYPVRKKNKSALPDLPATKSAKLLLKNKTSREDYIQKVKALKDHIQRGNIYEINYCIQFFGDSCTIDPLHVFKTLHQLAKAPYAKLFKYGDEFIISASPELFLKKEGERVLTKPIKGTIRRGKTEEEDLLLKNELHTNLKERTENVMAVDVARNDLSMFARKGSVEVNKLYNIETFETVHQMVSTVSCEAKPGTDFETMIASAFPMASMTGAPKLRAMQLIDAFEDFERRAYSGAMGLIDEKGDFDLSVIIRSIFYNQKTKALRISVGGAITYLSDPEKEYEECLLKAQALFRVLNVELA